MKGSLEGCQVRHQIGELCRREPRGEARHEALPRLFLEQLEVRVGEKRMALTLMPSARTLAILKR
jgi:hypothetical protein